MNDLREEILGEIRRTVAADLELPGPVELHHGLATDLQVDSIGAIVLAVALEDRFRVKLTGVEAGSVVSVEDLVGVVERAVLEDRAAGTPQDGEGRQEP
ncbi:MAG TPA: phosphopantetheine-binding protein [Thermoanaerobaculia bacterium]|nr:phosphopantetheine-binding protein [Thermoanaerobaculia bacterium]